VKAGLTDRSSAWFGPECRLVYNSFVPSGAGPGAVSEAQRRVFGGNGFFFLFPPNDSVHLPAKRMLSKAELSTVK
jgi:hypothetical protein